ncbi:ChaB family protein [Pseudomonas sp.]|uniref:ChaB family protein n=1 Tax=Pseudomonas sp. TaxID=306 RepID=UPI003D10C2F5
MVAPFSFGTMPQAVVEKLRREAGDLAARIYEQAYRSALERYKDPARAAGIAIAAVKRHFYQDKSGRWRRRPGHEYRNGRWYVNGRPVEGAAMPTVFYDQEIVRSLVELDAQPLEGAEAPQQQWLLLVPVGEWQHPLYGRVVIRAEDVRQMEANFRAGKLGTDVPVDYPDHRDDSQGAYGWVREVQARDDGLWGLIEWTDLGRQAIAARRFKYLSPVLFPKGRYWISPRGEKVDCLLTSVSLTNRPFFRYVDGNQIAANLAEYQPLEGAEAGGWRACPIKDLPFLDKPWNPGNVPDSKLMAAILGPNGDNWDAYKSVNAVWRPPGSHYDDYKLKFGRREPPTDPRGRLVIIPNQLKNRMAILFGARGGVDLPASAKRAAYRVLSHHYRRLGLKPPDVAGRFAEGDQWPTWPDGVTFYEGEDQFFAEPGGGQAMTEDVRDNVEQPTPAEGSQPEAEQSTAVQSADSQTQPENTGAESPTQSTDSAVAQETQSETQPGQPLEASNAQPDQVAGPLMAILDEERRRREELEKRLAEMEAERRFENALRQVEGWKFSMPLFDGTGRKVGSSQAVLAPAHRELCAKILLALPDDLARQFADVMSNGGFQLVSLDEFGALQPPEQDAEALLASLPVDTRQRVEAVMAEKGCSAQEALDLVVRAQYGLQ